MTSAHAEALGLTVPEREEVPWPGRAADVRSELVRLARAWQHDVLDVAHTLDLGRPTQFPWPDPRPLHRLLAWVNIELMKNAAEIGMVTREFAELHQDLR